MLVKAFQNRITLQGDVKSAITYAGCLSLKFLTDSGTEVQVVLTPRDLRIINEMAGVIDVLAVANEVPNAVG